MPSVTVSCSANSGGLVCTSSVGGTYEQARSGSADLSVSTNPFGVGQGYVVYSPSGYYYCQIGYLEFDITSVIPDGSEASDIRLELYTTTSSSLADRTYEVRAFDYGSSLVAADWVPGSTIGSQQLLASRQAAFSAGWVSFTPEAALLATVGGVVRMACCIDSFRAGVTPVDREAQWFRNVYPYKPRLVITYSQAATQEAVEMALSTSITLKSTSTLTSDLDVQTRRSTAAVSAGVGLKSGTGAGQADLVWSDTRTLAASATEDLDLAGSLTDAFGATLTFARVKEVTITAAGGNTNNVVAGNATSNGFVGPWGATGTVSVRPGGFSSCCCSDATGWVVTAGTGDLLKVANSGSGTSVTYTIKIVGCSA